MVTTPTTRLTTGSATGKATIRTITGAIAVQFGETEPEPQRLVARTLRLLGAERVRAIVVRARGGDL
jgi:hypothetical protein